MGKSLSNRARRRLTFLEALASGSSVADAGVHGRISWSTLYRWRQQDAKFRAAWDDALRRGQEAMQAQFDSEMVRRAVAGVDDPVFYQGEVVGTRRRYSDRLLMFGIRDLRLRQRSGQPAATAPRVTVIVDPQLGGEDD